MKQSFSKLFGLNEKNDSTEEKLVSGREEVKQIPIIEIVPNRYQPRTVFQDDKINELARTIQTHGIIQPIVVRERNNKFEIIAGERRWRAVTKLGWETIPAVVKDFDDAKTASVALIENLQREGLTSIEEAMAYAKLLDIHGLTQESLAQRLGKGQSTVANKLRLLNLPNVVQDALLNRQISERHARALIILKDQDKQEKILSRIIEEELNVKQTEEAIKKLSEEQPKKKKKPFKKAVSKDTRLAMNTIRKSVDMVAQTGMTINTDEEEHDDYYQFTIRIPKK
ncbi:nucleoid occlusion protein [Salipaludibacillus keqinensis]|uniref:Nucleoid occlusion protein n=1 Tax=Salipaludibacillus keqinensis TaxID=2045207 RepID=A0A323TGV4_9BACI|nr:nucleoid occlusion protein [Salipaludibacillus keqinensis]PYZ91793.1 nucleoid occlusion protein [Salipaludibacillus keqinensis]